jgi:DNA-binding MarR family transcriptional regulator
MHLHVCVLANDFKIDVIASMNGFSEDTEPHPTQAVTQAWIGLMRAQRRVLSAIEADFKKAGLPPLGWYDVLWELVRADGGKLRPFEIESRTLLAQYNLSRLIDRLEREGLVRRETFDADGRGRWVVATDEGRQMRARMWQVYSAAIETHVGAKLSAGEALELARLLAKLR